MNYISPTIFPKNIICAYSTKAYGEVAPMQERMSRIYSDKTKQNRRSFLAEFERDNTDVVELFQVHSDIIISAQKSHAGVGMFADGDALISKDTDIVLSIVTSDCLPIFMYDQEQKVLAVVHAGWKGVYAEIIQKTIKQMSDEYEIQSKDLLVWIGPAIGGETYCFTHDHFDDSPANAYFEKMGGVEHTQEMFCVDLRHIAARQLQEAGVSKEHIEISEINTKEDDRFYSYQADDRTNNMGIIMMK